MKVRERIEEQEYKILSLYAAKSRDAVREKEEDSCSFRTAFQRDRDRIIHSKAFRRLKHKTQVYIAPGDHYRMRMTHSLEMRILPKQSHLDMTWGIPRLAMPVNTRCVKSSARLTIMNRAFGLWSILNVTDKG